MLPLRLFLDSHKGVFFVISLEKNHVCNVGKIYIYVIYSLILSKIQVEKESGSFVVQDGTTLMGLADPNFVFLQILQRDLYKYISIIKIYIIITNVIMIGFFLFEDTLFS